MKVLITGAGGQLGTDLVRVASARHEVTGLARDRLDVGDRDAVMAAVTSLSPDLIVHAGAWTAVDACESDPETAFRVNAFGCRNLAEASRLAGSHLVSVSTDYVFDGEKEGPYVEWDRPNPASVYGLSKLAGEEEVRSLLPEAAVVRTSWVCGAHGSNMVKTVLRAAGASDQPLRFVDDQKGHPTFTDDLASMLLFLGVSRRPGVFHVTNQGPVTWYQFARDVLAAAGMDPERVLPVSTAEFPRPARRPANSVLDNAALRMSGIALLPHYSEALARTVKALTG